jgi:hypothetical protein
VGDVSIPVSAILNLPVTLSIPDIGRTLGQIELSLVDIRRTLEKLMALIDNVTAAQATEHTDLMTALGLLDQLLVAFAEGKITQEQAKALVDQSNADDATLKTKIGNIQDALGTTPPVTPGP